MAYTARDKRIFLRWTILILYVPFAERESESTRRKFLLPFPEQMEAKDARRNHERDQQARRIQEEINHLQLKLQTSLKERESTRSNIQSNRW